MKRHTLKEIEHMLRGERSGARATIQGMVELLAALDRCLVEGKNFPVWLSEITKRADALRDAATSHRTLEVLAELTRRRATPKRRVHSRKKRR